MCLAFCINNDNDVCSFPNIRQEVEFFESLRVLFLDVFFKTRIGPCLREAVV